MQPVFQYGFLNLAADIKAGNVHLLNRGRVAGESPRDVVALGTCQSTPGVLYMAGYVRGEAVIAATTLMSKVAAARDLSTFQARAGKRLDQLARALQVGTPPRWFTLVHPDDCAAILESVTEYDRERFPYSQALN